MKICYWLQHGKNMDLAVLQVRNWWRLQNGNQEIEHVRTIGNHFNLFKSSKKCAWCCLTKANQHWMFLLEYSYGLWDSASSLSPVWCHDCRHKVVWHIERLLRHALRGKGCPWAMTDDTLLVSLSLRFASLNDQSTDTWTVYISKDVFRSLWD